MPAELTLGALSDIAERARPTGDMAFRRVGGAWTPVPWSALRSFRREVAAALHEHGVRHGDRVAILSHTCWEWGALDLAITTLGAISVGVYPTSTAEQIGYILHHAKVKVCFAEAAQVERLRATFATVPGMKLMVIGPELDGFRAEGREVLKREPTLPEERLRGVSTDDDATWVYTSGTSGPPKGAVLTHQGVLAMSRLGAEQIGAKPGDVAVSYLPMAHVLTRVNYYAYVRLGGMAWYAESLEKVAEAWLAARPSIVSLVPRVLEKAQARILDAIEKSSPTRQKIFKRALAVGLKKLDYVERGRAGDPREGELAARALRDHQEAPRVAAGLHSGEWASDSDAEGETTCSGGPSPSFVGRDVLSLEVRGGDRSRVLLDACGPLAAGFCSLAERSLLRGTDTRNRSRLRFLAPTRHDGIFAARSRACAGRAKPETLTPAFPRGSASSARFSLRLERLVLTRRASLSDLLDARRERQVRMQRLQEHLASQHQHQRVLRGPHRRRARHLLQQRDLTEHISVTELHQQLPLAREHLDLALRDEEELVTLFAELHHVGSRLQTSRHELARE